MLDKGREGKEREGDGREGEGKEGKGWGGKGRKGKERGGKGREGKRRGGRGRLKTYPQLHARFIEVRSMFGEFRRFRLMI